MQHIEKKNGVKIRADVKVRFEVDQKHGRPDNALEEFANLVQKSLAESSGSVIPLKFIDSDQWVDALKTIQEKENKLLVTLTSETMTVRGPGQSQEAIKKFLYADTHRKRNTDASHQEYERETQESLKIDVTIKDDFPHAGLIIEKTFWKSMTNSYNKEIEKIKAKFNVAFNDSDIGQGKVNVTAFYKKEGNASMESHALRDQVQEGKQSSTVSAGEEICTCSIPVGHFWYVNHMYEEEMQHIEKKNVVKIMADVKVRFEVDQKHGSPDRALEEFANLVQKSLVESSGSVIPLKFIDSDQWGDALKTIQKKKNKLLVTLTSETMTVRGPGQSQDVISKCLYADTHWKRNTDASHQEYERETQDTSLKIDVTTKDHLMHMGLTMEESYWKVMITSYSEKVAKIKDKFNVDLKESDVGQGKVNVKAVYKKDEGNASMESHAVRELFHLYQKTATSPMNVSHERQREALKGCSNGTYCFGGKHEHSRFVSSQFHGATGFSGTIISQSEGASNEPVLNGQSANRKHNIDPPTDSGKRAGDQSDERCPICLDKFKNKRQLNCKHEFCKDCLKQAEKANGPICPICRVVFGKIVGDQPDGRMSHQILTIPLPGYSDCGTIMISYEIPSGTQTEKHPNPGQRYFGIRRQAYLPDNKEGNEVLRLLKKAFGQKLIFTIGTSRTTGMDGQVTWNDIHHKTSTSGGPDCFGYPDPEYLSRVKEELKAKGIE
uniref:E3 ubiquitin-protein ligase n=1 Tax=Haplochromis burtoni TaxID=8153 RepID=A0A3Q3D0L3_HAPBU